MGLVGNPENRFCRDVSHIDDSGRRRFAFIAHLTTKSLAYLLISDINLKFRLYGRHTELSLRKKNILGHSVVKF